MHIGVYICRGNFVNSHHFSEGGYDRTAKKLFQDLNVDTYHLEYDPPRSGDFKLLKSLPKKKNAILGVITSKFSKLEHLDEMGSKVFQAADIITEGNNESHEEALKRLGVSPQCRFARHSSGKSLGRDDMAGKLRLIRQLADSLWTSKP